MKRIYFTLIILLLAMVGMAYLYFSKLNRESEYSEVSLRAATSSSGLIFCLHHDKSVFEILKDEALFQQLIGEEKFRQMSLVKSRIIAIPEINNLIANTNIYISFLSTKNKEMDYLISTQLNDEQDKGTLMDNLKSAGFNISSSDGIIKLTLGDSTTFYMAAEKNLILLSNAISAIKSVSRLPPDKSTQEFIAYIKQNNKLNRNSVGNLFIDYNKVPALIRSVSPEPLNGNLSLFAHQDSFSALNYNFSKEKLFFSGSSRLNDASNYMSLFANAEPQKNTIDNLLPQQTANFTLFCIPDYKKWRSSLQNWFVQRKEEKSTNKVIKNIEQRYHLDAETIIPRYFKDQLITFQLASSENIGAINLSNGDKVKQLLLDISDDYDQEIKAFKVAGLLYAYFGDPFRRFDKPYYTIIDNYLVFANQPGALHSFLQAYRRSELLVNTPDYVNLYAQISGNSNITFYVNHDNSASIIRKNTYTVFYDHFISIKGLGKFSSLVYQLSGDKGAFQTNFLINAIP